MTLAVENANSKLVDVFLFAGVDIQDRVDDRLVTSGSLALANQVRQQLDDGFSSFSYSLHYSLSNPCCCFFVSRSGS